MVGGPVPTGSDPRALVPVSWSLGENIDELPQPVTRQALDSWVFHPEHRWFPMGFMAREAQCQSPHRHRGGGDPIPMGGEFSGVSRSTL